MIIMRAPLKVPVSLALPEFTISATVTATILSSCITSLTAHTNSNNVVLRTRCLFVGCRVNACPDVFEMVVIVLPSGLVYCRTYK